MLKKLRAMARRERGGGYNAYLPEVWGKYDSRNMI